MQLALKVMLSNGPEYWAENVEIQKILFTYRTLVLLITLFILKA